jgi:hypothetical protein
MVSMGRRTTVWAKMQNLTWKITKRQNFSIVIISIIPFLVQWFLLAFVDFTNDR